MPSLGSDLVGLLCMRRTTLAGSSLSRCLFRSGFSSIVSEESMIGQRREVLEGQTTRVLVSMPTTSCQWLWYHTHIQGILLLQYPVAKLQPVSFCFHLSAGFLQGAMEGPSAHTVPAAFNQWSWGVGIQHSSSLTAWVGSLWGLCSAPFPEFPQGSNLLVPTGYLDCEHSLYGPPSLPWLTFPGLFSCIS